MTTPPDRPVFLSAAWRYLLMLNWVADPVLLASRVPRGTALALYEGRCYISVVGFLFDQVRLMGLPIPGHTRFPELNLRFYVVRETEAESRRGVVFVREIAPRRMVALVANILYNEKYLALPMRHTVDVPRGRAAYTFQHGGRWQGIECGFSGEPTELGAGSHEEFISHQLWGYTARSDGRSNEYHVSHPRWRVWPVDTFNVDVDADAVFGPDFSEALSQPPATAFLAEGSAIRVHRHSVLGGDQD